MKRLFLLIFVSFQVYANPGDLSSGIYKCVQGNEESICDQLVRPYGTAGRITALKVEYVGWCGSMGPYTYYCNEQGVCENPGIKFTITGKNSYRWENKQYGFYCDFLKSTSR